MEYIGEDALAYFQQESYQEDICEIQYLVDRNHCLHKTHPEDLVVFLPIQIYIHVQECRENQEFLRRGWYMLVQVCRACIESCLFNLDNIQERKASQLP